MLKKDTMKLFKNLFGIEARTRKNWKDMLDSLATEGDITERQASKFYYFGASPTQTLTS